MYRTGIGYDVHRLVEGRKLFLGGIEIPHSRGLLGHSDADVLLHAVVDAILGAICEGDIGTLFPDSDNSYKDRESSFFVKESWRRAREKGYKLGNLDVIVIAQEPKLKPYVLKIREKIAELLESSLDKISIKATTQEGLGFTGRGEGIACWANILLEKESNTQT